MELEQMSVEEVTRQYHNSVRSYRYHSKAKDFDDWQKEKPARLAAGRQCEIYAAEFRRRGLEIPYLD